MRVFWFLAGVVALGLGMLGAVLPGLPTVVFILIAAYAFSKSSPRLHVWLMNHKVFGPMIDDWNTHGRIRRSAKWWATASIAFTFGISIWLGLAIWILCVQALVLLCVLGFIWTRPE